MEFLGAVALILILYFRTWRYNYLIDDNVPRGGYLLVVPTEKDRPHYSFYDRQKSKTATFTNVSVFIAVCWAVYLCFGWQAALLYAVFPLNVSGVAWNTGNYYMTTVLFVLAGYYFITNNFLGDFISMAVACAFYVAALGSTVSAIPFAFVMPLITGNPSHAVFIIPLLFYLFGKRFQIGLKVRKDRHKNLRIEAGKIKFSRFFVMTKVMAYYIVLSLWPSRLGFFHDWFRPEDKTNRLNKSTRLFYLSFVLLVLFSVLCFLINPAMAVWWFLFMGIFSQFTTFGQFTAERYTYIPNVAFCVLITNYFHSPVIFAVIAALWFYRSWLYTPSYRNNKALFIESMSAFPLAAENYTNLSSYYIERGLHIKAIEPLFCALKYATKDYFGIQINIAGCYAKSGMFEKALYHSLEALKLAPEDKIENVKKQILDLQERLNKIKFNQNRLRKLGII